MYIEFLNLFKMVFSQPHRRALHLSGVTSHILSIHFTSIFQYIPLVVFSQNMLASVVTRLVISYLTFFKLIGIRLHPPFIVKSALIPIFLVIFISCFGRARFAYGRSTALKLTILSEEF